MGLRAQGTRVQEAGPGWRPLAPTRFGKARPSSRDRRGRPRRRISEGTHTGGLLVDFLTGSLSLVTVTGAAVFAAGMAMIAAGLRLGNQG